MSNLNQSRRKQLNMKPLLPVSRPQSQIRIYRTQRSKSRNLRQSSYDNILHKSKIDTPDFGDIFQASEKVFRNSLAFNHPAELTLRPIKREMNRIWKEQIRLREYEQLKTEGIRRSKYIANYELPEHFQWYRGKYI